MNSFPFYVRLWFARVRPPERVAISQQILRAYKWSEDKQQRKFVQESIIVREMAHAHGPMTIFLQIPEDSEQRLPVVLQAIGYWGQTSSLTSCMSVTCTPSVPGECATPLSMIDGTLPPRPYFSCLATEFRSDELSWHDIVPDDDMQRTEALHLEVYVWPMITEYHHGSQKLLVRAPLTSSVQ